MRRILMKLEDQSVHTAQICDDPVWKRKNEIVLADDGKEKRVMKHNYIDLKHKARYNNNNHNEVKRKIELVLDQGKRSGMSLKFYELNY